MCALVKGCANATGGRISLAFLPMETHPRRSTPLVIIRTKEKVLHIAIVATRCKCVSLLCAKKRMGHACMHAPQWLLASQFLSYSLPPQKKKLAFSRPTILQFPGGGFVSCYCSEVPGPNYRNCVGFAAFVTPISTLANNKRSLPTRTSSLFDHARSIAISQYNRKVIFLHERGQHEHYHNPIIQSLWIFILIV